MNVNEILKLKSDIDKAELEKANLQGQLQITQSEIKEKFNITFDEIDQTINEYGAQIKQLEKEIKELSENIEKSLK